MQTEVVRWIGSLIHGNALYCFKLRVLCQQWICPHVRFFLIVRGSFWWKEPRSDKWDRSDANTNYCDYRRVFGQSSQCSNSFHGIDIEGKSFSRARCTLTLPAIRFNEIRENYYRHSLMKSGFMSYKFCWKHMSYIADPMDSARADSTAHHRRMINNTKHNTQKMTF
jgi:hypothetical protein